MTPSSPGAGFAVQGVGKVGSALVQLLVEARAEVIVSDVYESAIERRWTPTG